MTSSIRQGTVPGFDYTIGDVKGIMCMFCLREGISLMAEGLTPPQAPAMGLCEPCATLAAWAWERVSGWNPPGPPFAQTPGASLVLIVKERPNDFLIPFEVLMVSRKDDPGAWGLPGGKIETGESPNDTAVRELREETSLASWQVAMEKLYCGYSPRGRLVQAFLCRGWEGEPKPIEGLKVEWKAWPPSSHSGMFSGFYKSLEEALMIRWKLQKVSTDSDDMIPLSTHISTVAADFVRLCLKQEAGTPLSGDESRRASAYQWSLSQDEREFVKVMKLREYKGREERAIASLPEPPSYRPSATKTEKAAGGDEGDEEAEGEHEEDDNAAPGDEADGGDGEGKGKGFVRGR